MKLSIIQSSFTILVLFNIVFANGRQMIPDEIVGDEMIEMINRMNTTWKAGRNFDDNINYNGLLGLKMLPKSMIELPLMVHDNIDIESIPESFDSRKKWSKCRSISKISDQGGCGSCWAISSVDVISDRICIASNGTDQVSISVEDLMTCCKNGLSKGCHGGFMEEAFYYYVNHGLVSGGAYNSNEGCQPYQIPPCEHHTNGTRPPCPVDVVPTPPCLQQCRDGYNVSYENDKHYGSKAYYLPNNVEQIQIEIMKNGPVTAAFKVYNDFLHYKSGIYQHVSKVDEGGHAIRILGWGVDNGTPYWLCANSWNTDWADMGGYFKILRGSNECQIESSVVAGLPKL
ncbi:hypothetical protein RDWZM_010320 [Blomia tropicalis]|uniref:Peptidase C1A papain C-terminal domain-containing protein n=1 Tax=Blomia tropicalis TaxID=40697 RepID=A0A9Q0LY94_BLOTA|nr:hypothetical protein RDWZM_010320 [Blomia tropicalis]